MIDDDGVVELDFLKQKAKLRSYYKQLKAGMVDFADIPVDYQILLRKYYGVDENGF